MTLLQLIACFFGYRPVSVFEDPSATGTGAVRADENASDETPVAEASDVPPGEEA